MLPNGLEKSVLKPLPRIRHGPTMHRNIYSRFSLVSADREEIHTPLQANMEETLGQDNETTGQTQTASSVCEERSSHDENIATASITPALNELQDSVNMEATQIHQERERKRQTHQLYEARRRQTIEDRRRRLALMPEPRDGVYIQVKYGDGSARGRRFCLQHSIQILFDFAGSDDMATEVFHIQTATSSTGTPSTATGSLSEHGLCGPTTVYVLWLGPEEVQEMLSHNALVSVPVTSSEPSILLNANSGAVAEAAEGSVVALSWPWFIPIEEASVERPPLSPSHSPVTSLPNPHIPVGSTHLPTKRRRPDCSRLLERERAELQADREELERQKAELEADRAWLERQRAELDQERVVLERERVELEMDRDVLDREREKEEAELERERTAVQRARERVEHSRRVLSLFHTLLQKL